MTALAAARRSNFLKIASSQLVEPCSSWASQLVCGLRTSPGARFRRPSPQCGALPTRMICHQIKAVVRNESHAVNTVNLTRHSSSFF